MNDLQRAARMGVRRASHSMAVRPSWPERWSLPEIAGRLTELSGIGDSACLTVATTMVLDAQMRGETTAWITGTESAFYPPDVAANGVDLEALVVVRVAPAHAARAADRLTRSGAFGLVVLDLDRQARVSVPLQARLRGLAQKHDTAVLCITRKAGHIPSLGSMVSLRGEVRRHRTVDDRFSCEVRIIKDKRRGPGWTHCEYHRGPDGLC